MIYQKTLVNQSHCDSQENIWDTSESLARIFQSFAKSSATMDPAIIAEIGAAEDVPNDPG